MPDERDNPLIFLPYLGMKMPDYPLHPYCRGSDGRGSRTPGTLGTLGTLPPP